MSYIGSLPGVSGLRVVQAGFFSLSLGWDQPSSPVQGYRLTYGPRGQAMLQLAFLVASYLVFELVFVTGFVSNWDGTILLQKQFCHVETNEGKLK